MCRRMILCCSVIVSLVRTDNLPDAFSFDRVSGLTNVIDVAIIGSGPAGCGAGVYSARAGARTGLFAGHLLGGQLTLTEAVENFPGVVREQGAVIMKNFLKQVNDKGVMLVDASVIELNTQCWPFRLTLDDGTIVNALTVVIATGSHAHTLGVPGEKELSGRGVSACATCDGWLYQDKDVVVVGGGDSAFAQALHLSAIARSVTVLVRSNKPRACLDRQHELERKANCSILYNHQVRSIVGNEQGVTGVEVADTSGNKTYHLSAAALFVAVGRDPVNQLCIGKLKLDTRGSIVVDCQTQETSIAGVYAAGDVAEPDSENWQAGDAATAGGRAGRHAVNFLNRHGLLGRSLDIRTHDLFAWYQPKADKLVST